MWYYLNAGQQQGPLDDAIMDGLIARGIVTPETLVWTEGQAEWVALKQLPAATMQALAVNRESTCSMCHQQVGADNLIELMGARVCAACKPLALQSLREGATLAGDSTAWRQGNKVVARDATYLPKRCLKCNCATEEQPMKRSLYWHNPAFYLLILINLIIYVIVAIIVRKRASLYIYLCAGHLRRRKYFIIGGWAGAALGFATFVGGIAANSGALIFTGIMVIFAAIIIGIAGAQLVRVARIENGTIWLRGAGKEFIASLPSWIGSGS